jgi:hypothetical protein
VRIRLVVAAAILCRLGFAQTGWQSHALPFRPLNIASVGRALWVCGADEGLAVSTDDGRDWKVVRHEANGRVLLNVAFADPQFGYAAGSNGLLLATTDGGASWTALAGPGEAILEVAFADPRHGLIRTPSGLRFTADGGAHWLPVPAGAMGGFRYSFALEALDAKRMMAVLKEGPSQSFRQTLLVTTDGGATWMRREGPDAILGSFVVAGGEYWAVGEEAGDKKNGGRRVPVALHSADGERWTRARADLFVCREHGCTLCTNQGCLASNGTLANVFPERSGLRQFAPNDRFTPEWAATDSAICFVGSGLECAPLGAAKRTPEGSVLPPRRAAAQPPLGAAAGRAPLCLISDPSELAPTGGYGAYELRIALRIAPNGTVENVEVAGAPAPEVAEQVRRKASAWVYEPTIVDGVARSATATMVVRVDTTSR